MAQPRIDSTESSEITVLDDYREGQEVRIFSGGSDGGGNPVDKETKRYVDKSMDVVRAENDKRFSEVLAKLDVTVSKIDGLRPISVWQMVSVGAAFVLAVVTIFGVMADRFDGGISAFGLMDKAVQDQMSRDANQDERLDKILTTLEASNVEPEASTPSE